MSEPLEVGATWLPADTGPHLWADLRPARAASDLAAMRRVGITSVRLHLAWDAFVPSHRQVSRLRLRDLDTVLEAARALGMRCVLVLFAQTFGDGLLLPRYAIDRDHPRRGVRVVSDGVVERGGPRDQWADPLMLEVEVKWLEALLGAFANHPAVSAWDLGHDPATTLRPRRTAHMVTWVELLGGLVRARGDRVRLTLGARDVLRGRGVRLGAVAPHLDELGLVIEPQRLGLGAGSGLPDLRGAAFTAQLAMRLASSPGATTPPLHVVTGLATGDPLDLEVQAAAAAASDARSRARIRASVGIEAPRAESVATPAVAPPHWDIPLLDPVAAERAAGELLTRQCDSGVAGLTATSWTTLLDLVVGAPPLDRQPSFARHGVGRPDGELRPAGEPWSALARAERAVATAAPWPDVLDVEGYYAALPDSARDLFGQWAADRDQRD